MIRVLGVLLAVVVVAAGLPVSLWVGQELMIYPGLWLRRADRAALDALATERRFEVVQVPGADGPVELWWRRTPADRSVLMFHGNGQLASDLTPYADAAEVAGWQFVAMEYRGYGATPGWPSEAALVADARVAWRAVTEAVGAERVVILGSSLGGGVASALAAEVRPAGLVLESTFDALVPVAASRVPVVPESLTRWMLRSHFESAAALAGAGVPLFQVHDRADPVVPFAAAERLAAAVPGVTFHATDGVPHGWPVLLIDDRVREAWVAWSEAAVPVR